VLDAKTHWLSRFVLLRLLGVVYVAAYAALIGQLLPLLGHAGLLPIDRFLEDVAAELGSRGAGFRGLPSLFWISATDAVLLAAAWLGLALAVPLALGFANALTLTLLWALYLSFVNAGQVWYGYGWETLLLECGFLAIFACPLLDPRPFPKRAPALALIVLFRWLALRLMLGAGLIKLRGDPCWLELSCLDFHFETQPLPNPLSPLFHFLPHWAHALGVGFNHAAELVAPLFAFGPRPARLAAGAVMAAFQLVLIASGNLSFLNWLTLVPILACFDDSLWRRVLPRALVARAEAAAAHAEPSRAGNAAVAALCVAVALLSIEPLANMASPGQVMNTSFDPLRLVNTYGAFGSVGRVRDEIVLEGTLDDPDDPAARWRAYELPCKPGDPMRPPCWSGIYQRRLDWQIWFAAMGSPETEPWTLHLVWKLLHADRGVARLLAVNPFPEQPPRAIRADLYRYELLPYDDPSGAWWRRRRLSSWLPPLTANDPRLTAFLDAYGWRTVPIERGD
jgi:hypothetical protein